jgi:DNA-binding transcriptional LysR family regulator
MAMELRHLRYFVAVAEEGHITGAAERLGMQQPPLSQRIRALERELDVQLFRRKPRGVELTDAGQALLIEVRAILYRIDHAVATTKRTARGEQGRLAVGFTSAAAFHPLVASVIREFREIFPMVSVAPAEAYPFDLIDRIGDDQIDVAFMRTQVADPEGLVIDQLLEEPMVVALPGAHTLAQRRSSQSSGLPLTALAGETFIVYGRPHGERTLINDAIFAACHAAGFSPRVGEQAPHIVSTLNLVAAGLGISIVSASLQRMRIDGVTYRRLRGAPQPKAPLVLVSRRGDPSPLVRQFLRLVKRSAKKSCA